MPRTTATTRLAVPHLSLPGINGNSASTPSAASLNITGDIDIIVLTSPDTLRPGSNRTFLSKYNAGTSNRAYELALSGSGFPVLTLSLDGTAATSATCSERLPASFASGGWLRATWRQSDGRVQWFTASFSLSTPSWTQLGTDGAILIASIFQSNTALYVGARDGGSGQKFNGKFWQAVVKNGIDGTVVFDAQFYKQPAGTTSFNESSSNAAAVTISQSGSPAAAIVGRSAANRANLSVAVGSYTGNGTGQTIAVGFMPDLIIVQGSGTAATHSTTAMPNGTAITLGTSTAISSTTVTARTLTGFTVGTNSTVNTNAATYYYVAVSGNNAQNYFRTVSYVGNGSDGRQLTSAGLFMQPDIFWTRGGTNDTSARVSAQVGDDSFHFAAINNIANAIQAFVANGVELGTSALANASGTTYYATGFVNYPGIIASGQYTGNGADDRTITTGIDTADLVVVKAASGATSAPLKLSTMAADTSFLTTTGGTSTTRIKNTTSTGFTIGTSTNVNGNGTVYNWFSIKAGNFDVPITRNLT